MILEGTVAPGFERIQRLYERNMRTLAERNTQLCVYVEGECVVDLWGSAVDDDAFSGDSLVNVFSSGKSLEAIALAMLNDQGLLDYSAPIQQYWPEFAQGHASSITVADLMRHEAGLAAFDTSLTQASLQPAALKENAVGSVIERQTPRFREGADASREYHAITRGWIANEIFRRLEPQGRTMGEYLREVVSEPLGADVYIGLREDELERVSDVAMLGFGYQFLQGLVPRAMGRKMELNLLQTVRKLAGLRAGMKQRTTAKAPPPIEGMERISAFNLPAYTTGEIPSAGAKCSARGLAKLAAVMANRGALGDVELMSPKAFETAHAEPVTRDMMSMNTTFTQGGLATFHTAGPSAGKMDQGLNNGREGYYGWMGLGGSIFQWHPEARIGFAYVPTSLNFLDLVNERGKGYQAELARCLG